MAVALATVMGAAGIEVAGAHEPEAGAASRPRVVLASWYGPRFEGRTTASGDTFDQHALTAAHRTLPFGTQLDVTNLTNGRTVTVVVNDRGPYFGTRKLDLSRGAAREIGMIERGVVPVLIEFR